MFEMLVFFALAGAAERPQATCEQVRMGVAALGSLRAVIQAAEARGYKITPQDQARMRECLPKKS